MPSRKKAKGKARKAAKEAKAEEAKAKKKKSTAAVAAKQQEGSLEAQMQRLEIINSQSQINCMHGSFASTPFGDMMRYKELIQAFVAACDSAQEGDGLMDDFIASHEATKEEFADVYSSKLKLEIVISFQLSCGTRCILNRDNDTARFWAAVTCYFEEWVAVSVRKTKALINWSKIFELYKADDHTLVQFYRKRIPCSCLDKKYKEVKSVKKMGWCYNPSCSKLNQMAVRSKMFYCTRCGEANYCSIECQKANWKRHKWECDSDMEAKAAFDAKQQS